MYRTQHNDGREREVGKRRREEKEGVEVKRIKEEEREGTEEEGKITFWRVRGREREREEGREREREGKGGRELVWRKRMEESEGGR